MTSARRLTILWVTITLIALGWPADALPENPTVGIDKLVHILLYLVGTVLALRGWPQHVAWVVGLMVIFAAFTEVWQWILPTNRYASMLDVIANLIGMGLGWLAATRLREKAVRPG